MVFLFWTEHRGEGWDSGQSTRLPSIWPGFRSCYVRHIWVRDWSLFIAWVRGRKILGGITWFLGEKKAKGGISCNWEPKSGDRWKLRKDSEGWQLKFAWKTKTEGGGGNRESHQKLLGGSLQWSNIQRGYRLNFTLFCPKFYPRRQTMTGPLDLVNFANPPMNSLN